MRKMWRNKRGIGLIEAIILLAVSGFALAIGVEIMSHLNDRWRAEQAQVNLKNIFNSLATAAASGGLPGNSSQFTEFLKRNFIKDVDPWGNPYRAIVANNLNIDPCKASSTDLAVKLPDGRVLENVIGVVLSTGKKQPGAENTLTLNGLNENEQFFRVSRDVNNPLVLSLGDYAVAKTLAEYKAERCAAGGGGSGERNDCTIVNPPANARIVVVPGAKEVVCIDGQHNISGNLYFRCEAASYERPSAELEIVGANNNPEYDVLRLSSNIDIGGKCKTVRVKNLKIEASEMVRINSSLSVSIYKATIIGNKGVAIVGPGDYSPYNSISISISSSTIIGSSSSSAGVIIGDTTNFSNSSISISDSTITGSGSGDSVSGVYLSAHLSSMSISNSTITGSSSGGGYGVYLGRASSMSISNSTITGSGGSGGYGVYLGFSNISISSSTIEGSSRDNRGVTIDANGSIQNTTIRNNNSGNADYGVYVSRSNNISGLSITSNYPVYVRASSLSGSSSNPCSITGANVKIEGDISSCTITTTSATPGSGFQASLELVPISRSSSIDRLTAVSAGGIRIRSSSAYSSTYTITNSTFRIPSNTYEIWADGLATGSGNNCFEKRLRIGAMTYTPPAAGSWGRVMETCP